MDTTEISSIHHLKFVVIHTSEKHCNNHSFLRLPQQGEYCIKIKILKEQLMKKISCIEDREKKLKYFSIITIKRQMLQDKKKHTECVLSQFSDTGAEQQKQLIVLPIKNG